MPEVERQIEFKMHAYVIKALKDGEKASLPPNFFSSIVGMPFDQRWDNKEPKGGSLCKNLAYFKQVTTELTDGLFIYEGALVEVHFKEQLDLFGWDGQDEPIPLPPEKGTREFWGFTIAPAYNLLVLEAGRFPEKKLYSYLNYFCTQIYNIGKPKDERLDGIVIEAIPVEDNPVSFMRNNPNLGSFEAVINAREFLKHNYGPLGKVLAGVDANEERLILKVSVSSQKRGKDLPTVLVTNLADFIESIEVGDLAQARVSEYEGGKKLRPTKLLGAIHNRQLWITDNDQSRQKAILDYSIDLIENNGEYLKR